MFFTKGNRHIVFLRQFDTLKTDHQSENFLILKGRGMLKFINIKLIIFGVFALLAFGAFLVLPKLTPAHAAGNTYYVRADGTVLAANKANATSPTAAATSLNMAQVKLASFAAGDHVLFSSQGGGYTEVLNLPSSGSGVGNEITYANVPTETPVITVAVGPIINTNLKSNIIIDGFSLVYTGASTYDNGVRVRGGSNIAIRNMTINMGGKGLNIATYTNPSGPVISNLTIENSTLSNNGSALNPILIYNDQGTVNSDITITNVDTGVSNYGVYVWNASEVVLDTVASTGIRLENVQNGSINTATIASNLNGNNNVGIKTAGSSDITINNVSYTGNDFPFTITSSNDVILSSVSSTGNTLRSWYVNGASTNVDFTDCTQTNAGGYTVTDTANNVTFNGCTTINPATTGFSTLLNAHDIAYNDTVVANGGQGGYIAMDNVYNLTYNGSQAISTHNDGFVAANAAHDITWRNTYAYGNGDKTSTSAGDGFTTHDTNYNIYCYSCISAYNTASGFAMTGTTSGKIYNSIAYKNAGNWSLEGGGKVDQNRGGFYIQLSGNNPTTGTGWDIKNSIGYENYPREIFVNTVPYATFDYNLYKPTNNDVFATINSGGSNISWTTYHVTDGLEPHSLNADPKLVNPPTDFHLQSSSPAIDSGYDTNITTDYAGKQRYDDPDVPNTGGGVIPWYDIGAYEYVTPPDPSLHSTACPSQTTYCLDTTPDITVTNTSSTTSFKYLVNQILAPLKASVEAGTADADGSFTVPDGQIHPHATYYIHVIAQNLDGDYSDNYSTYKVISRDSSGGLPPEEAVVPETQITSESENQIAMSPGNIIQNVIEKAQEKPTSPTITNMTIEGTSLLVEGRADPNTTVYLAFHSNPYNAQTSADSQGYWKYILANASKILGQGDHTVIAISSITKSDNTFLESEPSKTYDFKLSVDDGQLKVEMKKTKVWQWVAGGAIVLVLIFGFLLWRRRIASHV